ncbi:SRPBCC family protein (plasmid) [Streptomyces sp. BI20]|uniref:SRPBCC family protein n=1 Tax=Streptomyces sp. BI20 TaxID=3403460 RepID=UPI003C76787D
MENAPAPEPPSAHACMLIRRPAAEVFDAFVDPAVTTRFWYTDSSGPMTPGAHLRWEWRTYGASAEIRVEEVDAPRLLRFTWGNYDQPTAVELRFTPRPGDTTFVEVAETGFRGSTAEALRWVGDTVGGFTTVLCSLKALLEHDLRLDAVPDHHPA